MIDTLAITLALALMVSIAITSFTIWYSIKLSRALIYFSENMNDKFRLDVWKIILTEDTEEGEDLIYFYSASPEPITKTDDLSV